MKENKNFLGLWGNKKIVRFPKMTEILEQARAISADYYLLKDN